MNLQTIRTVRAQICVFMGKKKDKVSAVQFVSLVEFLYPDKHDAYMRWKC